MKKRKPDGYWTKENILSEAKKYTSRTEFNVGSKSAYNAAYRKGWLEEACAHMERKGSRYERFVYSIRSVKTKKIYIGLSLNPKNRLKEHISRGRPYVQDLIKEGYVFKIHTELLSVDEAANKEISLIIWYRNRGWKVVNKMKGGGIGSPITKYNKKECFRIANLCENRKEFQEKHTGAYSQAHAKGWIDELFEHHYNKGFSDKYVRKGTWNKEHLRQLAEKFSNVNEFKKHEPLAHKAALRKGWINLFFINEKTRYKDRMPDDYWTLDRIKAVALKYRNKSDFRRNESAVYAAAQRKGLLDKIFESYEQNNPHKRPDGSLTIEALYELAKKYGTRSKFRKLDPSAEVVARRMGVMDEIFKELPNQGYDKSIKPNGFWNIKENIVCEAKKHLTISSFINSSIAAYNSAKKHGWYEEIKEIIKENKST